MCCCRPRWTSSLARDSEGIEDVIHRRVPRLQIPARGVDIHSSRPAGGGEVEDEEEDEEDEEEDEEDEQEEDEEEELGGATLLK